MLGKLIILCLIIFIYFWVKVWYKGLDKDAQKKAVWNIAVGALVAVMLLAFLTGRMHWAGLAFAFALGALKLLANTALRYSPLLFSLARQHNFSTPQFRTRFLNVKIITGKPIQLEGDVIEGPHKGATLKSLSKDQLVELANHYKDACKRSYYLILVALQGAGEYSQQTHFDDAGGLTQDEAIQILGLEDGFTEADIKAAHKKLMQKLHPDKGGNAYLASRVNLAKTTLLKK